MKIYLAAAFSRQKEIREVASKLTNLGITIIVTSRWLYAEPMAKKPTLLRTQDALNDIRDLREADMIVRFADNVEKPTVPSKLISGARMFEFGMAWERGMPVFVVGGKQNVFDYLPNIVHFANEQELLDYFANFDPLKEKSV